MLVGEPSPPPKKKKKNGKRALLGDERLVAVGFQLFPQRLRVVVGHVLEVGHLVLLPPPHPPPPTGKTTRKWEDPSNLTPPPPPQPPCTCMERRPKAEKSLNPPPLPKWKDPSNLTPPPPEKDNQTVQGPLKPCKEDPLQGAKGPKPVVELGSSEVLMAAMVLNKPQP